MPLNSLYRINTLVLLENATTKNGLSVIFILCLQVNILFTKIYQFNVLKKEKDFQSD